MNRLSQNLDELALDSEQPNKSDISINDIMQNNITNTMHHEPALDVSLVACSLTVSSPQTSVKLYPP